MDILKLNGEKAKLSHSEHITYASTISSAERKPRTFGEARKTKEASDDLLDKGTSQVAAQIIPHRKICGLTHILPSTGPTWPHP